MSNENILEFYKDVNRKRGHYTRYGWLAPMPYDKLNLRKYRMTEFESEEDWYEWITEFILD